MIKKLQIIGITIALLSLNCAAQGVVVLKKGDVVPFDGVLFSKEREKQLRLAVEERDYYQKSTLQLKDLGVLNQKEIDVLASRVENYQKQSVILADRVVASENSGFVQNFLYFGLGVLATGLSSYVILKTHK